MQSKRGVYPRGIGSHRGGGNTIGEESMPGIIVVGSEEGNASLHEEDRGVLQDETGGTGLTNGGGDCRFQRGNKR